MSHPIVHVELSSTDRAESARFYQTVFGWSIVDHPEMNYTSFSSGGANPSGGGFNPVTENQPAGAVIVYIQTDDVDANLAVIEANGGKTLLPTMEIPNTGWFALFLDPSGNQVGLYKALAPVE